MIRSITLIDMTQHFADATHHLETARGAIAGHEQLMQQKTFSVIERHRFQDTIRFELKLAEVSALLSISERLLEVGDVLERRPLEAEEARRMFGSNVTVLFNSEATDQDPVQVGKAISEQLDKYRRSGGR